MKLGEPRTVCIPQVMHRSSDRGLMILPTYVHGATNVLPVHRGENEYNEIFVHAQRGTASLTIGKPIAWECLQPNDDLLREAADSHRDGALRGQPLDAVYQAVMVDIMLGMVADLAPDDRERGPYAAEGMRKLRTEVLEGAACV